MMDPNQNNTPPSDADLRRDREQRRLGDRRVDSANQGFLAKLMNLFNSNGRNTQPLVSENTGGQSNQGQSNDAGSTGDENRNLHNTSPGQDDRNSPLPRPDWRDSGGNNINPPAGTGKNNGKRTIFLIFAAVLVALGLIVWQLYEQYISTQHIDSGAEVERNTNVPGARISGQQVSQEYADKVKEAENERKKDSNSFVAQSVDVLGEKDKCVNCEARVKDLETLGQTLIENDQTLDRNVGKVHAALEAQGKDLAEIRQQIANLPRQGGQQPAPIPEAFYYKDYKGHEYMNLQRRQLEAQNLDAMMGAMAAQNRGENIQHFASYSSLPTASSSEEKTGSNKQVSGPVVIPSGYYSAQLEIGVNTDKGVSPIVATITTGAQRGTRLIARGYQAEREGVQIVFTEFMTEKGQRGALTAYAIDAESKVSGVASDVDRHYGTRILGTVLTRAIQGWGDAYANQGTTTISDSSTIQTRTTSSKDAIRQGIGAGAGAVGDIIDEIANRPATIVVDAHTYEIGVYVVDPGVIGEKASRAGSGL